jgi:hypothetical protein
MTCARASGARDDCSPRQWVPVSSLLIVAVWRSASQVILCQHFEQKRGFL